jgi:hypothetical protein
MRKREIDRELSAAFPLGRAEIEQLPLEAAEHELIAAILAEPREARGAARSSRRRSRLASRAAGLATAGVVVAAIVLVVFGAGGGSPGSPTRAYGAEQLRLAKISPHILLDPSSWRVAVTESLKALEGWTEFQHGRTIREDVPPEQLAKFRWHSIPLEKRERQVLSHGATIAGTAPVLDTTAQVYSFPRRTHGLIVATALWSQSGRAFEFRSSLPSLAAFERRLGDLERVDKDTWLKALPQPSLAPPFAVHCTDAEGHVTTEILESGDISLIPPTPLGETCKFTVQYR